MEEFINQKIENTKILIVSGLEPEYKNYYRGKLYAYEEILNQLKDKI